MMKKPNNNHHGFTLIELMITLVISGIIVAAIYATYVRQQRIYVAQDQVAEMQQNLRAGLMLMTTNIRMAGYNPVSIQSPNDPKITKAISDQFGFTLDLDGNGSLGDANESVVFGFKSADDSDVDGIADAGVASLGRDTGGGFQPVAENIQAIEFNYVLADGTTATDATANLDDIRSVQISILARAGKSDTKYTNNITYTTASGVTWGPYNDNYRRRFLKTTVLCRNLGL